MPRYEHADLSFDVPRDWEDRTVVAFAVPSQAGPSASNVVVTRDTLRPGEAIVGYADRQLAELAKRLEAFQLLYRKDVAVAGLPGTELRFLWKGRAGDLDQRLMMVATRRRAVLNFTATAPRAQAAELQPTFDRIFASVKIAATA